MRVHPAFDKWSERAISVFKYLIAGYMMLAGAVTTVAEQLPTTGPLGFLYSSRVSLVIIGLLIFTAGAVLLYGKIRKSKRWTGRGLFYVYMCFLFASILNYIAYSGDPTTWVSNLVVAGITGTLYLRWKFKTEYINPNHFKKDINDLLKD